MKWSTRDSAKKQVSEQGEERFPPAVITGQFQKKKGVLEMIGAGKIHRMSTAIGIEG